MPDVTLPGIAEGVVDTWKAVPALLAIVPAARVYFGRAGENAAFPYVVFEFADVTAYFGGTEYFSGAKYIKTTRIEFSVYGTRATDWQAMGEAMSDALGWSRDSSGASWVIPNAVMLAAMPEVEGLELTDERVNGEDVLRYKSSFSLSMQADRG